MFDIFYSGKKPGLFAHERAADSIEHAQSLSRTRFFWWVNPNSPRGMVSIDPETRDVINPEYLREVRKVGGKLANVELETISTAIKDPMKEADKKK